jgi:nickel-type superoxide dismutase maturation protease
VTGAPLARRVAVLVLMAVGTAAMFRSVHRVEVVGDSMTPSLMPGDRLVVMSPPWWRPPWPVPGTVVAVRDPRLPQRLLIKRVVAVDRGAGTFEVTGDNPAASTDSRTFGPVPRSLLVGRAVYRYAPADRGVRGVW